MAYFSDLLGVRVTDVEGEEVGHLEDVLASIQGEMPHPVIRALAVQRAGQILLVPYESVAVLVAPAIPLNKRFTEVTPYIPRESDLYLARDILDKQIIDTNGVRVVRVNDLELARVNGHFYVANVDISLMGLLRRLGLKSVPKLFQRLGRTPTGIIAWDNVELLPGNQPMRLRVSGDKMAELHPADLAEIITHLNRSETDKFIEALDVKTLADTLEEVETDFQMSLVETMSDEKVADVLEEMAPDAAADLLGEMSEDRSQVLLKLMEHKEAEDVRKLLTYAEDTAGGIMTTDFIAVRQGATAQQVIDTLRQTAEEHETEPIAYVYVTDDVHHLLGAFSLQELVLVNPLAVVDQFMHPRVASVKLNDSQDEVAQIVSKYNLSAVPVVDEGRRLHGIVTADDALDKIIPTAWKKRLPRMYR